MKHYKTLYLFFIVTFFSGLVNAALPVVTDSRIKTFVYNENEVFNIVVNYGYQSSIEFSPKEEIEAISLGNSYSWKMTRYDNRIFIKSLEGAAHTNMTVLTDKRTYHFEIESQSPEEGYDDGLMYVVRFFYPDESFDKPRPAVDSKKYLPKPIFKKPVYNFDYTLTGPEHFAPVKVFDDGEFVYFEFPNNNAIIPHIFLVEDGGQESRATYTRKGKFVMINKIRQKIVLKLDDQIIYVYNETLNRGGGLVNGG